MRILLALIATFLGIGIATSCAVPTEPTPVQPAEQENAGGENADEGAEKPPVKLSAKRTPYKADEFASGGPYSCVKAVVTNQSQANVEINPFFFGITGTDGEKREAAVGAAANEFDSVTLAPGEKASGTVCSETTAPAKTITFTDGLFEAARAEVAA